MFLIAREGRGLVECINTFKDHVSELVANESRGLVECINTFKYHVLSSDGKISVQNIFYYLFFHRRPTHKLCFLSCRPFVVNATFSTGLVVSSVSWLGQLTVDSKQKKLQDLMIISL